MSVFNHLVPKRCRMPILLPLLGLLCCVVGTAGPAYGKVLSGNPNTFRKLLGSLQAGDTLVLKAGVYKRCLQISNLHGEPGNPIVITGPETGKPAIFEGSREQAWNTVQISKSSYLTLRHLKLDGLGVPYIDAVNSTGITHHITLEHLEIVGHGAHQLTVGIATRGPAWDWVIRRCKIVGAGTGMYLGNSTGKNWPFVGGLIEHNLFMDTVGYNTQLKHMQSRSYGNGKPIPGMPQEDRKTIIRHNVFSKAKQHSPPTEGPRCNLLVGHFPLTGPGSNDVYEIYGNFFHENTTETLFQGEGNIAFYNNLLINSSGNAIRIVPHNDVPRNILVAHNTVVATGRGIQIQGADAKSSQLIVGNAVFAGSPVSGNSQVVQRDNVTAAPASARDYLVNPEGDVRQGKLSLFPRADALQGASTDLDKFKAFSDWGLDFNGNPNSGTFRGAYAGGKKNSGWTLAIDFKPTPEASPSNKRTRRRKR